MFSISSFARAVSKPLIPLLALLYFSFHCQAQDSKETLLLEAFTGVVSVRAQLRFQVTRIMVGNVSVDHLFVNANTNQTNWRKGGYFTRVDRPLRIRSGADLNKLRGILLQEGKFELKVTLEDHHLGWLRRIPGLRSARYQQELTIPVSLSSCDRRTQLIYTKVTSLVEGQMRMEGETTAQLEVSEAFYKLLSEELEDFIKSLPRPTEGPCPDKIELEKFVETKGLAGFESGGYQLTEGLKSFLDIMRVAMRDSARNWLQYHLDVKVIGYADRNEVRRKIDLSTSLTGIDEAAWQTIPNSLEVYYDGCKRNRLEKEPVYFDLLNAQGKPIREITDNCELGAVRAYIAVAYLKSKFGADDVDLSYATGGVAPGKTGKVDPADRRINMIFTMKGARKGK
jgi:hypothetical protein